MEDGIQKPTIAILGASSDRRKFGNRAVRAFQQRGYRVFPINPKADTIEGLPAYRSIRDVPLSELDMVSLYLPPEVGIQILPDIAGKKIGQLWLNPGSESPELIASAQVLGLHVVIGCSILDIGVNPHQLD